MSRRSTQTYRCPPIDDLARQLVFSPADKRAKQLAHAERLHDEIEPGAAYPVAYIVYRITGYRLERAGEDLVVLPGDAVLPDLRLLIDQLSRSLWLGAEAAGEPIETIAELADRLGVSTKTVHRWRADGLRWRWFVPEGSGRRQIGLPRSAVEQYQRDHAERVARAVSFTQIPPQTRRELLGRARRIAERSGASLNRVATHLARKTGRAVETLRLMLEKHDQRRPGQAIFGDRSRPLSARDKRLIERAHRVGIDAARIAARFGKSPSTVRRVVKQRRGEAARSRAITFVGSRTFDRDDADAVILRPGTQPPPDGQPIDAPLSTTPVDDLPGPLQPLYRQPWLEPEAQRPYFIRMNYLKHKADRIRRGLGRHEPRVADLDAFDRCLDEARRVRDLLVRVNLPVVLSVAKRHLMGRPDPSATRLVRMLEAGNEELVDAVDTYNASLSQTFDSYLTNRLLKRFAAGAPAGRTPRAVRRISGQQSLRRMIDQAGESGVNLAINPGPDGA